MLLYANVGRDEVQREGGEVRWHDAGDRACVDESGRTSNFVRIAPPSYRRQAHA